jgi:glycosyltransferase involved in cell wall biosynthesis
MLRIKNVFYTPNGAPFLSGKTFLSRYLFRQAERFANRLGGKVVCCSPSELNAYQQAGISATCISNGIKLENRTKADSIRKNEKFRIITTGRIIAQKNPSLFNTIATYFSEFDQFEFVWAGDGENREILTAKNILVTGWLHQNEIKRLVSDSNIYLSTALYEGLSFGVLEALTLNKPVLLSYCVGNMDAVKNGINGDLFQTPTDAILKIIQYHNNRDMLRVMGEFSKSICETEFNVKNNFSIYRQLYANTIDILPVRKWAFA